MPTFRHGKSTVFKVDNSGGTLTDISNTLTDVSFPQSVDTAETSTFGSSAKSYVVGLTDATISVSGNFDATVDAHLAGILVKRLLSHLSTVLKVQQAPMSNTQVNVF